MFKPLIIIFFIPLILNGQINLPPSQEIETTVYCQAITEYLKILYKKDKFTVDTLFVGKHEEFPDIKLPGVIENTKIALVTVDESIKRNKCLKPFVLINLVNLVFTQDKAKFMIINLVSLHPQHNCLINFKYNIETKKFELDKKIKFENPYSKNNN